MSTCPPAPALPQVVLALGEAHREHVPFRSSKLSHVLKDSLGGNCRTIMIANIWGEASQVDETLSTCRFAQRMMRVACEVTQNLVEDSSARVKQLQRWGAGGGGEGHDARGV